MRPPKVAAGPRRSAVKGAPSGQPQGPVLVELARGVAGAIRASWGRDLAIGAAAWGGFAALVLHYLGIIG